jgi:adenylate cyclase
MTLTRSRHNHAVSHTFENEFAAEILKSERLRVTMLMGVIATTMGLQLFISLAALDDFRRSFHGRFGSFLTAVLTIGGVALASLFLQRVLLNHRINLRARPSAFFQYASAFIETSIPTVAMIVGANFIAPVYTLFTPAGFVYALFIVLSILRLNARLCIFTGAVAGVEYAILATFYLSHTSSTGLEPILTSVPHHAVRGMLFVVTGVAAGVVTTQIKKRILKSLEMIDERNRISRTFGEYVSPVVMDKLLTLKPDLRSEKKQVCVMFLDIRDFTTFSEKRPPEEVFDYLESLFEFMIEIVNRHHGVVNKFLGDGFMAVFGAPLSDGADCLNAIAAAREILMRVNEEVSAGRILPTNIGIGLHFGEAVTGSIGSSLRREYAVIGDVVNLASRIEQLNKQFGSQILMSESVWSAVGETHHTAIPMGQIRVKGREAPVQLYQMA